MGDLLGAIGGQMVDWLLPTLLTAVTGLVMAALTRFFKKQGIELTAAQEARLRALVRDAVNAIEERAARDGTMTSEEKHEAAISLVRESAPQFSEEAIDNAIDAARPSLQPPKTLTPSTPATFGR